MRAAVVHEIGAPPRQGETARPEPGDGEAVVEVAAASLNPIEIRVAAGHMGSAQPPYIPGLEGVGRVVRSDRLAAGSRVRFESHLPGFGKNGVIADVAVVDDDALVEVPDAVSDEVAAAVGVVGITATLALQRADMSAGDRVAVMGATGGVGQMAVQLATAAGASTVVAVGRDAETLARLEAIGARPVRLTGAAADLTAAITTAADGQVDVVVDMLWGAPGVAALGALGTKGRLVNVGNAAGVDVTLPLQAMRKSRSAFIGMSSGWVPIAEKIAAYRSVVDAVVAGTVAMAHEVHPLADIAEVWQLQAASPNRKLVISLTA